jgi:hypothetical protein
MPSRRACTILLILAALTPALPAAGWQWEIAAGPWSLEPLTSPVERRAERIVASEAQRLLAPLLSEFTVAAFAPAVAMRSHGWSLRAGCWRRLGDGRFAVGAAASYLRFSLPFSLRDERDIYFEGIPLAHVTTEGRGMIELRTFMLSALARWRFARSGRIAAHAGLGLTLLRLDGDLRLPLSASIRSILGSAEVNAMEDISLAEIRKENDEVPAWILSPALTASLHYRLGKASALFVELGLTQGTFLSAGVTLGE